MVNTRTRRLLAGPLTTRRPTRSFVLLEIVVAMVLLGIALTTMLRSYTMGLKALSYDQKLTQAVFLAQTVLDGLESEAPQEYYLDGDFAPDYPDFSYTAEFEDVEIKYDTLEVRVRRNEFEPLRKVVVRIFHKPPQTGQPHQLVEVTTYLTGIEKYTQSAKQLNALF